MLLAPSAAKPEVNSLRVKKPIFWAPICAGRSNARGCASGALRQAQAAAAGEAVSPILLTFQASSSTFRSAGERPRSEQNFSTPVGTRKRGGGHALSQQPGSGAPALAGKRPLTLWADGVAGGVVGVGGKQGADLVTPILAGGLRGASKRARAAANI